MKPPVDRGEDNRLAVRPPECMIHAAIGICVALANLVAVLKPAVLLHDEPMLYGWVLADRFPWHLVKFALIRPFVEWPVWQVMAVSPPLARGLYVALLMIPLSAIFYRLFRSRFGLSRMAAFTAAVLPNILPLQWQIPAGINMSYVLWGALFAALALRFGLLALDRDAAAGWTYLAGAVCCCLVSSQIVEAALFFCPALLLAFLIHGRRGKKKDAVVLLFSLVAMCRSIQWAAFPRKEAQLASVGTILRRIMAFLQWQMPFPGIPAPVASMIFLLLVIAAFVLYQTHARAEPGPGGIFARYPPRARGSVFIGFFLFWVISSISPVILFSGVFHPRYVYFASFGASALVVFSLRLVLQAVAPRKSRLPLFAFILLLATAGVSRSSYLDKLFAVENDNQAIIIRDVGKRVLPRNAQVVVVGLRGMGVNGFDGGWARSSGYFKYALKRGDLTGLISPLHSSPYYDFDDHFNPQTRGFWPRFYMTGLSLDQPVFLFRLRDDKRELEQLEYALQWRGTTGQAPWTVFRFDAGSGKALPFMTGTGMREYLAALEKLKKGGISQSRILWGGPPDPEERARLAGGARTASRERER